MLIEKRLKVGIIGAGNIFQTAHAPVFQHHPEVEVIAICDVNIDNAQQAAKRFNMPKVYTDYREMLQQHSDLDVIDICTPNVFHAEIAIAGLKAGMNVFIEKPDAIAPEMAIAMSREAERSGKILMAMRNNRFRPAVQFIKKYITSGQAGEIYTGRTGWIRRRGIPGKGGWFTTKALSGGGPLIDLGVHFIDVAVWLMGNPRPVSVVGATYRKFADTELSDSVHSEFGQKENEGTFDVEDLSTGFIRFENGATLQVEFSWASNIEEEKNFVELRGTNAGISFDNGELKIFTEIEGTLCDIHPKLAADSHGHTEFINHFINCVQGREKPIMTPDDGVYMIKLLSALYESAQSGNEVKFD